MTKIRALRQARGLKLIDLAYATKVHPTQLTSIERGHLAASARAREAICAFLEVDKGALFDEGNIAV
ncbi:MAG: helix-turn-helix transcriptional regulator [Synergistaceae bacterium]|nr:helix-turn-helix transcriptional regulator [Synergistaceae bacterium]